MNFASLDRLKMTRQFACCGERAKLEAGVARGWKVPQSTGPNPTSPCAAQPPPSFHAHALAILSFTAFVPHMLGPNNLCILLEAGRPLPCHLVLRHVLESLCYPIMWSADGMYLYFANKAKNDWGPFRFFEST